MPHTVAINPKPSRLWLAAHRALRTIPGLKQRILYGFALNFVLYILVASLVLYGYWNIIHAPMLSWITQHTPLWLSTASSVLLFFVFLVVGFLVLFFSLRISIKLMAFWHEDLVERIVRHFREVPDEPFSINAFLHGLGLTLRDVAIELAIALGLFALGLIPLLGPILVFLIASHLAGKGIMDPYLTVMRDLGHKVDVGQFRPYATLRLGWLHMLLVVVPVVGWLLMPVSHTFAVIGLTWLHEVPKEGLEA